MFFLFFTIKSLQNTETHLVGKTILEIELNCNDGILCQTANSYFLKLKTL